MNCGATRPCAKCGMSDKNTVHTNISQFGHHDWVSKEEEQPEMSLHEAVCRMIAELQGFTDRPDYCMPPKVREATEIFIKSWAITDVEIDRYYGEES